MREKMTEKREAPVAFVTGSSRGIGLAIAEALAEEGFSLVLHGKQLSPPLKSAASRLKAKGTRVLCVPFDISDIGMHTEALKKILDTFGRIDCLVNNAGISVDKRGDLLEISEESFDRQISVNLRAHFFLTQHIARWMISHPAETFRSIINVSSSNAEAAALERGEYAIAKTGISMMTKLYALRLAEYGICVNEVRPGLIRTDMTERVKELYDQRIEEGFSPINRWGETSDVGKVVSTLASGKWSFVTGESIRVDGGLLIPSY